MVQINWKTWARAWYSKLNKSLISSRLCKSVYELACYVMNTKGIHIIVGAYLENLQIPGSIEETQVNLS